MSPSHGEVGHVSDTALMVAACRALETDSPDGCVRDPFAARLAGERGLAILQAIPHPMIMQFGIGVRSRFIDELLLEALAAGGIETVVSLGCGLDTRPWRLEELEPDLRWIEADFAALLDYKDRLMSPDKPRCRRERVTVDVNDTGHRRDFYAHVGPAPALLITEGLLMYLPGSTVDALAAETSQRSGIVHWIGDFNTTAFSKAINMETPQSLRNVQAPDSLPGEQILATLQQHGWTSAARRSYITGVGFAAERIQHLFGNLRPRDGAAPAPPPADDPSGVHCLTSSAE
jgi:methyltransferase (TIGR00027 family)